MSTTKELIGTELGTYTIVDHIATGGMAEIFLACHEGPARFKKDLVLKVLQSRWEEYPEVVDLFLGEARISALMRHPNIVEVFDVAEERGRHFIAMEYIAGKTLTELAKRAIQVTKAISVEVGVYIAAEIAGALAYMFDGAGSDGEPFRVVHRDISPTNVLISKSGQVKLIDFGIARQGATVAQEAGARPGKVTYMSPEQVMGVPIDGRSDIFCLGTILYEITLGRRLWRGPREVAVRRIVEERPKPPTFVRRDYPAELELIVLRALEKKPEDRYQSATELHNDLQNFLARSNAHLRNNAQMADYVSKIFSEEADALISEAGRKRAQDFVEGNENAEVEEELDFDLHQAEGPGAALARALRASALGVWAGVEQPGEAEEAASSQVEGQPAAVPAAASTDSANPPEPATDPASRPETAPGKPERAGESAGQGAGEGVRARESAAVPADVGARQPSRKPGQSGNHGPGTSGMSASRRKNAMINDDPDRVPRRWSGTIALGIVVLVAVLAGILWRLHGG